MKIAAITSSRRGEIDRLIAETAAWLQGRGVRLAGIVKASETGKDPSCACEMSVRVLPRGQIIKITQDLGEGSTACKLDPGAIARAVVEVEKQPLEHVQMFILNKFGPEEADGRGFRAAIGTALAADVPVLVGVGASHRAAFDAFVEGMAADLPPDPGAIRDWCVKALG